MTSTSFELDSRLSARAATPYIRSAAGGVERTIVIQFLGASEGNGGLYSSLRDMARFVSFQLAAYPPRSTVEVGPNRGAPVRRSISRPFDTESR